MERKLYFIRHGLTQGNIEKRYIGWSNPPLCDIGKNHLYEIKDLPKVEKVYVSPLRRCIETMNILYPDIPYQIIEELKECHFGDFENKNYKELTNNLAYQEWIDSGGMIGFPRGENPDEFRQRIKKGISIVKEDSEKNRVATGVIIAHGGVYRSIYQSYLDSQMNFFDIPILHGQIKDISFVVGKVE